MTGFSPEGYLPIGMAAWVAVDKWHPGEMAEEEERGGPRSFTIEAQDGSEVEAIEPSAMESTLHRLRQHLFDGSLPSYALADDGQIFEISPEHWGSRHADSEPQLQLLTLGDMPSYTITTVQGSIQGRPMIKLEDLNNLLASGSVHPESQPPGCNPHDLPLSSNMPSDQSHGAKRQRAQVARNRATARLRELYGDKIPTQSEVSNIELERAVNEGLPREKQLGRDTILRAAGRRQ